MPPVTRGRVVGVSTIAPCLVLRSRTPCEPQYPPRFQGFNLLHDTPHCPMCETEFEAVKPGFNICWWRIMAIQEDGTAVRVPFKRAEDNYTTYVDVVCALLVNDGYACLCASRPPVLDCSRSVFPRRVRSLRAWASRRS